AGSVYVSLPSSFKGYEMKKAIQKIVFPNGMVVQSDNRQLRPSGYNYLLYAITSIKGSYKGNKKGTTQLILDKSLIAEKEGFEPSHQNIFHNYL
ncbi:MAG: hypothetical protein B6I18_05995, partial [Bacteroidetes bacterium 4572_112]